MTTSTDGQICYGVMVEEEFTFPWDYDDNIEAWWRKIQGYMPPYVLYNEFGDYSTSATPSQKIINEYYDHQVAFDEAHPLPIELLMHCSFDYPMYILAVPGTVIYAPRGYPKSFNPIGLNVTETGVAILRKFCQEYGIVGKEGWWLSSLWS